MGIFCLSLSFCPSWKSYILRIILLYLKYLVFRNSSFVILNGYSLYWLCLTFWTNEFLGSHSNYKFTISFSLFSRMGLWRILCLRPTLKRFFIFHFILPF